MTKPQTPPPPNPPIGPPDLAHGDPIFARIYDLDLACPSCGEVFSLRSPGRRRKSHISRHGAPPDPGPYNYRTGRFQCPSCRVVFALGVLIYPVNPRNGPGEWQGRSRTPADADTPPPDWVPTYQQALVLRNQAGGNIVWRWVNKRDPRNTVIREGCTCAIQARPGFSGRKYKTRFTVNPECAIHGGQATPSE